MRIVRARLGTIAALLTIAAGAALPGAAAGTSATNIVAAPVRIAHTALGPVGYREVGSGSPLLLVTGFGATIDDWAPTFVDRLAAHHRVVVFDNAGAGATAPLRRLSILSMAAQTSDLIRTLRLGHPAVLGWSMGGMIAQALAVGHPRQVSRLILAATQAGTGRALPIPPSAAAKAASSNPATVLSVLFPANQKPAEQAYVRQILSYPHYATVPTAVKNRQTAAIAQWMAGHVRAGTEIRTVKVPTLVADGTADQLDPAANDRMLARLITGAKLILYPDAGHAFLFQDASRFVTAIDHFSG